tara:strand:+ start:93 stop:878 length:786 start_codon:yes stop_codon:yes gene_type:complete
MILRKGDKGDSVKNLQNLLGITIDGDFGPNTEKAVKKFQKKNNLYADGVVGPDTWEALTFTPPKYTLQQIYDTMMMRGYKWFNKGDYSINIVGIRNSDTEGEVTNRYDDHITVSFLLNGDWHFYCWPATTDPGLYWINNPNASRGGCAILVPNQYKGVYKIDLHGGKYKALCQRYGKVSVYRDGNKDDIYDLKKDEEGYFGINIHRSSAYKASNVINKYSAGCQVFQDPDDFDDFMGYCFQSSERWGNKFTYTLLESKDII